MKRSIVLGTIALLLVGGAVGCGAQFRAERDGRDLGEAVCDLREADDAEASKAALGDIADALDEIIGDYGSVTAEDRADIQANLADLAEHSIQGNDVLIEQDLAVLQRSAENIEDDLGEASDAAWRGFASALDECGS